MKNNLEFYTTKGIKKYLSEVLTNVKVTGVAFDCFTGDEICVDLQDKGGTYDFRKKYDKIDKVTLEQLALDIMMYNKEHGYGM